MSYSTSFSKAVLVVIFISDKIRQGTFEYLSTKAISETLNIPRPTLVKIMQSLHSARIIETKEGKNGGIRLARKAADITVLDVLLAVEKAKPLFDLRFNINAQAARPDRAQESLTELLTSAETTLQQVLAQKTIAEILVEMDG